MYSSCARPSLREGDAARPLPKKKKRREKGSEKMSEPSSGRGSATVRQRWRKSCRRALDRLLQNTDRLLDGLLLRRAHLGALREILDQHVARSTDLGEVA